MPDDRSRAFEKETRPRYWWHRLPGMDFVPPVYAQLDDAEWQIIRDWYAETDANSMIGECAVPLISLLHGLVMGNRIARIVQLGTCSGYSSLLIGFMLRRMNAPRALFTLDIDPKMCAMTQRWLARAGLTDFVHVAELNSLDPTASTQAATYLQGTPELLVIDASHEYRATIDELDLWYPKIATGGLILLHDVSRFAAKFDVTKEGGVRRAFDEWRKAHPEAESLCLNGESASMDLPRPLYKDACGLGIIHKPGVPNE